MKVQPSDPSYGFPFTPYEIQRDLMNHLYSALSAGQVTVIESPTGTGKSLSLISATLTFLRDAKLHRRTELIESIRNRVAVSMENEPNWVIEHEVKTKLNELERQELELNERLAEIRKKEALAKKLENQSRNRKRAKFAHDGIDQEFSVPTNSDEWAPDPYYENEDDKHLIDEDGSDNLTPAVREMMRKMNGGQFKSKEEDEEPDVQKIYFASRTHSQLSQFVAELRKTQFAGTNSDSTEISSRPIRLIPLGSRQNLCINDELRKRHGNNNEALGDACLELQKGGKSAADEGSESKRCPFLPPASEPTKLNEFRDKALASVQDIEDIEDLGRKMKTCPYYGSRKAVRSAEVVTLPYNLLMSKSAREALGISFENHIVVVDEAHNLIDSILQLHSISINSISLTEILSGLKIYYQKFKNRLTGSNAAYLRQLILTIQGLKRFADDWLRKNTADTADNAAREEMFRPNQILKSNLDQINFFKLNEYLKKSKIAHKIGGYVDSLKEESTAKGRQAIRSDVTRSLQRLQQFLLSLCSAETDGRILLSAEKSTSEGKSRDVTLRYMLLAPSESFRDVTEQAKSVILAGGTMSPMSDFREQLFPYLTAQRFSTFSCGHVVPKEHILTIAVGKGASGIEFEFKFDRRGDEKLLNELGQTILNLIQLIPKGIVAFVPSYKFLHQLQARWQENGLLSKLAAKKKIYWEPSSNSEVDSVLSEYSAANLGQEKGGLLFAVVGAKLSEGINFADDMARAVIVCGIPYPNSNSTELKERINFLNATNKNKNRNGPDPGQILYQNLAFRAVNQSIGRAIRNANDWAAIILLDIRYQHPSKRAQLPAWLGNEVECPANFGAAMKSIAGFMRTRKMAQEAASAT